MKTIVLTNSYPKQPYEIVQREVPKGFRLVMLEENTQDCLMDAVSQADYILASGRLKLTREVLDRAKKVKMVQRTGVGLDSLDLEVLREKDIPLYVNAGVNAESVAEHALLLILACLRRLPIVHRNTAGGVWIKQAQGVQTYELAGKTIGLVGMGNIARKLVQLLKGFGVTILYYDSFRLPGEREVELGVTYCEFEQMLPQIDVLSLHCPLTDSTRHIVNAASIAQMKPGVILVNTARGSLVDTQALTQALKSGQIAFAGLDVHEEEPLKAGKEIMGMENVILTPHIGGVTYDSFHRMMHDAMMNIEKFEKGDLEGIRQYLHG